MAPAELAPGEVPPTQNPAFVNLDDQAQSNTATGTAAPMTPSAAPAGTTAPGMNPPHGQPGHRCEIPVGAPLTSEPAKPSAQPQQQPASAPASFAPPAAKQQPAAPVATAPGMNPPHGQPGHTCSVAVGAPLPK